MTLRIEDRDSLRTREENAPDVAAATAVEGEIQITNTQEGSQTMTTLAVTRHTTVSEIAAQARVEGVAPSVVLGRALVILDDDEARRSTRAPSD